MSSETRRSRPFTLSRRTEADNLEEQVKALKELERKPGFKAGRSARRKKYGGFISNLKKKWTSVSRLLFKRRQKPRPHRGQNTADAPVNPK